MAKLKTSIDELNHQLQTKKLEAGKIGEIFGKGEEGKKNVAGIVLIIAILGWFILALMQSSFSDDLMTLILLLAGYMIGKNS